jgi:hypothetical protein
VAANGDGSAAEALRDRLGFSFGTTINIAIQIPLPFALGQLARFRIGPGWKAIAEGSTAFPL